MWTTTASLATFALTTCACSAAVAKKIAAPPNHAVPTVVSTLALKQCVDPTPSALLSTSVPFARAWLTSFPIQAHKSLARGGQFLALRTEDAPMEPAAWEKSASQCALLTQTV